MEEAVWGRIVIIGKDGKERKAEMELEDVDGDPYLFGRCAAAAAVGALSSSSARAQATFSTQRMHLCAVSLSPLHHGAGRQAAGRLGLMYSCALARAKTSDICINNIIFN